MGADGGSIAGRAELVRTAKRAVALHSVKEVAKEAANSCALSASPLRAPVVACAMGLLYNKDAILEYLLSKQKFAHFSHIQSSKDVCNANIHWNAAAAAGSAAAAGESACASAISANESTSEARSLYSCPITALPSNGTNKFVCMQPCGCVLSERAFRQVASGAGDKIDSCIACGKQLAPDTPPPAIAASAAAAAAAASSSDAAAVPSSSPSAAYHHPSYLTLFPGPEETLYLRAVMAERIKQREADKLAKKQAKKAGAATAAAAATGSMTDAPVDAAAGGSHKRKIGDSDGAATAADSPASTLADGAAGSSASTAAAASSSASSSSAAVPPRAKKPHLAGAHAALVSNKTGNVLSDHVRAITENAAKLVADRRKESSHFDAMFLTPAQINSRTRCDSISTKPSSLMGQL